MEKKKENKRMNDPKRGDIALCSKGSKGIITSDEPELMRFQNGIERFVWVGIYIEDVEEKKIGDPWYSQDPKIIDNKMLEVLRALYEAAFATYNNDDVFVETETEEDYDEKVNRDDRLGSALAIASKLLRNKSYNEKMD